MLIIELKQLAKRNRNEAPQRHKTALDQTHDADARQMLLALDAQLRQTLPSIDPIESLCSLVRHSERNITRA